MAGEVFLNGTVRLVDPMGSKSVLQMWGWDTADVVDDIREFMDSAEAQAVTAVKSYGKIITMQAENADTKIEAMVVPAGTKMKRGDLIVAREGAGAIYMHGIFPADMKEILAIQTELVAGNKTIGGHAITEVIPEIKVGYSVKKS